jgi:bifunctional lysine-specific demethylase and histidyl-hydroxylase NO66
VTTSPDSAPSLQMRGADAPAGGDWTWLRRCVNDPERFLAEDWSVRPSIQHRAKACFTDLFSLDELDRLLAMGALQSSSDRSPRVKIIKDGVVMPARAFQRAKGLRPGDAVIDCGQVARLIRAGGTVVVNGVDDVAAGLFRLCAGLEHELSCLVRANTYLSPPGCQGFKMHYDSHDVIILQISGTKKWQVYRRCQDARPRATNVTVEPAEQPVVDAVLKPGDSLYIPRGCPHAAVAADAVSLHVTLAIVPPSLLDLLRSVLDTPALRGALDRPLPTGFSWSGVPLESALTEGYTLLGRILTDAAACEEAVQHFTRAWGRTNTRDRVGQIVQAAHDLAEN